MGPHTPRPVERQPRDQGRDGPLVVPDNTVRLTAGGATVTQPLTIRMDPRVAA
jgi:hypothetical protein